MRGSYDPTADAVYIPLIDSIQPGESKSQVLLTGEGIRSDIVLDLDNEGRVLGIEVIGARDLLRFETLNSFTQS